MYAEYFGFSAAPFSVTPDPRFFYTNPCYHEAFASLRYGIGARKGFVAITGEVGTGKTTLLKILMQSVESAVHTAFIFNPKLNITELLRFSLDDFGVPNSTEDRLTLMQQLNHYLIDQHERDHIVALLVDEAQDLSDDLLEELRLLSNFETDKDKLIQIVLMGQPELERRLDRPELRQLKQRIAIRCRLAPLASHEVEPYINHRLKTAGYGGKGLFDLDAIQSINWYSNGIPRLINVICDNALLIAYASSKRKVSAEIVEEVARDLQLTAPAEFESAISPTDLSASTARDEIVAASLTEDVAKEEDRFAQFEMDERLARPHHAGRPVGLGMGMLLALFVLSGVMAASFSRQTREAVSELGVNLGNFSQQSRVYLSELAVTAKDVSHRSEEYIADLAVKIDDQGKNYIAQLGRAVGEVSRRSRDSLSGLAIGVRDFLGAQRRNLNQVKLIPDISEDKPGSPRLTDARDVRPSQWTEPAGNPSPPAEKAVPVTQDSKKPETSVNDAPATKPKATTAAEAQKSKNSVAKAESRAARVDNGKAQPAELQQASLKNKNEAVQPNPQKELNKPPTGVLGNFEVVEDSFVRDKPETNAEIITTLRPGTWVRVESKNGEYLQVRSLNDPKIRGYVHEEDAFFARIKR